MRKSVALILGLFVLGTSTLACANDSVFTTKNDNGTFMGRGSAMLRNNSNTKSTMASGVMSGGMTQATGTAVPVGTVITWPAGSNPEGWDNGEWFECNGSAIPNTPEYALLIAKLGKKFVPNYNGMFLRGSGEQTLTASDGTSITYKGEGIGVAQKDGVYIPEGSGEIHMAGQFVNVYGPSSYRLGKFGSSMGSLQTANTYSGISSAATYKVLAVEHTNNFSYVTESYKQGKETMYENNYYEQNLNEVYDEYSEPTGVKITNADPNLKETRPINTAVRYLIRAK